MTSDTDAESAVSLSAQHRNVGKLNLLTTSTKSANIRTYDSKVPADDDIERPSIAEEKLSNEQLAELHQLQRRYSSDSG